MQSVEELEGKLINFEIAGVGKFTIKTYWWQEFYEEMAVQGRGEQYLLVLPFSEKMITENEIKKEQEKIETKILRFSGPSTGFKLSTESKDLPFNCKIEMKLPSGLILRTRLEYGGSVSGPGIPTSITAGPGDWKLNGHQIKTAHVLVPEAENILEKIQMRIVPIGGGQNA